MTGVKRRRNTAVLELTMSDPGSAFRVGRETVTAVLTDGRSVTGVVEVFGADDEQLELDSDEGGPQRFPTSSLAYVAVHAAAGAPPLEPEPGAIALKVHLRTGLVVPVLALAERASGRGFRAIPRGEPRYREYYFFRDAVRLRERDEPIGRILVSSGAVHPEVLEHAIAAQQAHQNTPIGKLLVEALSVSESDLARAVSLQKRKNNRIGDLLIEEGLATPEQVERALAEQRRRKNKRIGEILLELDIVSEETLARTLAFKFDLRYVDLDRHPPDPEALGELAHDVILRHEVLPIQKTAGRLVLAIADPLSLDRLGNLGIPPGRAVEEVVVSKSALKRRIDELVGEGPKRVETSGFDFVLEGLGGGGLPQPRAAVRQTPMPRSLSLRPRSARPNVTTPSAWLPEFGHDDVLETLLAEAQRLGASVVHVEPEPSRDDVPVRLRVGRELVRGKGLPADAREPLTARLKELARLDPDERRPRTGKLRLKLGERELQYRLTVLPTGGGLETLVLHALEPRRFIPLTELDLSSQNAEDLERWLARPRGLVLVVGTADSGKTTTAHAMLARLAGPETLVGTVESPIEIDQPLLRQLEAAPGQPLLEGLQASLLADTDVIFVGALEDRRTASAAVDAALGEHRIISTMVARDAGRAVARLLELGVDAPRLADALVGVVNQRLVRRLCPVCREHVTPTPEQEKAVAAAYGHEAFARDFGAQKMSGLPLARTRGCIACGDSGYLGQLAVHELAPVDEHVAGLIARGAPGSELTRAARARGRSLLEDGIRKAFDGEADLDEILRVCG